MLAALLPLIETLAAEGGAAGALGGGAAAEGGLASLLGRALGGTKEFSSQADLGGALRTISDLTANIEAGKAAMESKRQQQEAIASKARADEQQYAFSDPSHRGQLADLAQQQQQHREEM